MTKSVVPKNRRADAVSRTLVVVVCTTGSRTVTPLTVCGNDDVAAFVSSASVTVSVNVDGGVGLADGGTERVGGALLGAAVGLGDRKTTREGAQSRTTRNTAT